MDDPVDPQALQVERGRAKSVNFDFTQHIIPDKKESEDDVDGDSAHAQERDVWVEDVVEDGIREKEGVADDGASAIGENVQEERGESLVGGETDTSSQGASGVGDPGGDGREEEDEECGKTFASDSIEYEDDRLRRFAEAAVEDEAGSGTPINSRPSLPSQEKEIPQASATPAPTTASARGNNNETAADSPRLRPSKRSHPSTSPHAELSRLLVEKVPLEILKRMVIRWPVGDERHRSDTSDLASKRLMITIWDVSGDPVQQNFVPLFFSHRCFFVSVYNLTEQLDTLCDTHVMRGIRNYDGSTPTNAEVLESWIGCATAFSKHTPSNPFHCTTHTPVLPPLIITCSNIDRDEVQQNPTFFHKFFERPSFQSYRKHLVDSSAPGGLCISNSYESSQNEDYIGHHLLRREVDHLARQMPYLHDNVPVQWVKFEQLVYGLQEQKKVVLLYEDLVRYISEHCRLSGPLQVLPVLAHFHDIGTIAHFHRHPDLSHIVFTKPQWLIDALSALVTSHPGRWVTADVQSAFVRLFKEGVVEKDTLLLTYRCARMPQRYWNEVLFVLNCMDLVCCHPSLHEQKALYLPCMVIQSTTLPFNPPADSANPTPLLLLAGSAAIPAALFNQLVVRCIRASRFAPVICNQQTHIQLNSSHHLVLTKQHTAIEVSVGVKTSGTCTACSNDDARSEYSPHCASIGHLIGEGAECMPCDNITTLIRLCDRPSSQPRHHLALSNAANTPEVVCPRVLAFVLENLQFLCHCWFPGLELKLAAKLGGEAVVLDECWKHRMLKSSALSPQLKVWFSQPQA